MSDLDPTASLRPSPDSGSAPRAPRTDTQRFPAGTEVAGRYRIVALLGKGGMGEVYRADDLVLGQSVALKFLPASLSADPVRLERFKDEVRLTRQISHPNVCRVYDIGESDGHYFLAMEYIDGEDLSQLIRRIGRLSAEKAVELARQICIGLAAAHEQGVIHRDLKPSNIMIDGRGKARLTDFGIAALVDALPRGADAFAGTPAYMAPEQLEGRAVSKRSDIYALGLVLYEIFTGKPAFSAETIAELRQLRSAHATPTSPSSLIAEIDPAAERVILRCLEPDPQDRPSSALAVIAALPGGDPLQAMIDAGETPSPELVAASGRSGALSPRTAFALVLLALLSWGATFALQTGHPIHRLTGGMLPPDVLRYRALEVLESLGYEPGELRHAHGFAHLSRRPPIFRNADELRAAYGRDVPSHYRFWFRAHTGPMFPQRSTLPGGPIHDQTTLTDPPFTEPGMIALHLSPKGRLLSFEALHPTIPPTIPPPPESTPVSPASASSSPLDRDTILTLARLDELSSLTETEPRRYPRTAWDDRRAWLAQLDTDPPNTIRIEAAAWRGRLASFTVLGEREVDLPEPSIAQAGSTVAPVLEWLVLFGFAGGGALTLTNLRHGRGDRRGALHLAIVLFCLTFTGWLIMADHHPHAEEQRRLLTSGLSYALLRTALACLLYLGLEPYIRRLAPTALIGWSRLLAGRCRDPIIGRDALVALAVCGVSHVTLYLIGLAFGMRIFDQPPKSPETSFAYGIFLIAPASMMGLTLTWVMLFVLIRAALRSLPPGTPPGSPPGTAVGSSTGHSRGTSTGRSRGVLAGGWAGGWTGGWGNFRVFRGVFRGEWGGALLFWLVLVGMFNVIYAYIPARSFVMVIAMVGSTAYTLLIYRFGFLAFLIFAVLTSMALAPTYTLDVSSWYAGPTIAFAAILLALMVFGYAAATSGRARHS